MLGKKTTYKFLEEDVLHSCSSFLHRFSTRVKLADSDDLSGHNVTIIEPFLYASMLFLKALGIKIAVIVSNVWAEINTDDQYFYTKSLTNLKQS